LGECSSAVVVYRGPLLLIFTPPVLLIGSLPSVKVDYWWPNGRAHLLRLTGVK